MKSFLSGRPRHDQPSLSREVTVREGLALPHSTGTGDGGKHPAPATGHSVECVKQGDKVVRLIITCACGERIEVDCLYPDSL